jgi:hypothetical protein
MNSQVNIQFLPNGTMMVRTPCNKDFIEAMGLNGIYRTFNRTEKQWYFHGKDAGEIWKLLEDFYNA